MPPPKPPSAQHEAAQDHQKVHELRGEGAAGGGDVLHGCDGLGRLAAQPREDHARVQRPDADDASPGDHHPDDPDDADEQLLEPPATPSDCCEPRVSISSK